LGDHGHVADADNQGWDVVKALGQVFALVAGFIGLVYAAGGGVLALRLYLAHLPARAVVGQLPRELLISIGLTQIVLPILGIAVLYGTIRLLLGAWPRSPEWLVSQWTHKSLGGWTVLIVVCAIPALAAAGWMAHSEHPRGGPHALRWLLPVTFVVTMLVILVALNLRAKVAGRYGDPKSLWNTRAPILWMTLIVAFASLPAPLIVAGTQPLRGVKVCAIRGEVIGVLIGETSDRTYVGDAIGESEQNTVPRPVFSIPQAQIVETIIGGPADSELGPHPVCPA
jgi:hypothetical protein